MKKTVCLTVLSIITIALSTIVGPVYAVELQKTAYGYTTVVALPEITVKNTGNGYVELIIPGFYYNNSTGKAALPETMFRLAVGKKKTAPTVTVTLLEAETRALAAKIHPLQPEEAITRGVSENLLCLDRNYYAGAGEKETLVSVSAPFECHGVPGVEVIIRPVSYNPAHNTVTIARKFRLDITMPEGLSAIPAISSKSSHAFVRALFENYDVPLQSTGRKEGYLILYESQYESNAALDSFITFRRQAFEVSKVKITDAGSSAAAIQSYIRGLNPKPTYVLFVGNPTSMPHFTDGEPSYWQYSLKDGSTKYSDYFVGMFSVRSAEGLGNIVRKTMYTEKNIDTYPKRVTLYSTYDGDGHIHNEVTYIKTKYWTPGQFEIDWQIADNNPSLTDAQATANTKTAINTNASRYVCYQGHGASSGFTPGISSSDLAGLTNTAVYPFVWGFACSTGDFSTGECFAEKWLTVKNGACMYTGASVTSSTYQKCINAGMARAAAIEPTLTKIGQIFYYAKHFVWDTTISQSGFQSSDKTAGSKMYNLFGDPALETVHYSTPVVNGKNTTAPGKAITLDLVTRNTVSFTIAGGGNYTVAVYTAGGRKIQTIAAGTPLHKGKQTLSWNGKALSAGVYCMRIDTGEYSLMRRFMLMQ